MVNKEKEAGNFIKYQLKLESTEASEGYFMSIPDGVDDIDAIIACLEKSPLDDFMRRYALRMFAKTSEKELIKLADSDNPTLLSLLYETSMTQSFLPVLKKKLQQSGQNNADHLSPLIYLKSFKLKDRKLHNQWVEHFKKNLESHIPMQTPELINLPWPVSEKSLLKADGKFEDIAIVSADFKSKKYCLKQSVSPGKTAVIALESLEKAGVFADIEMRHEASLSPIALLRKWNMSVKIANGRSNYIFSGVQTSYGKGLSLDFARASLYMEVVERCSSFASILSNKVEGFKKSYPLIKAGEKDLFKRGENFLSPNDLGLEVPYENEPLHWIKGESSKADGCLYPVLVPVQLVFLFCNLDEINLLSSMSSTGLASGNTIAEAKISALMEVVERNTEATVPYNPAMCFELVSSEPQLGPLLSAYRQRGVRLRFQDLTSETGIPCCKAFVTDQKGVVYKGTSANLDAKKAIISALTEVPWPFPDSPPTNPGLSGITVVDFEALPDYSTGNDEMDLKLIEGLLESGGYKPVYIDITREDINIPVVKAIIPGFEFSADMDSYTRVSPGLFKNYLKLMKRES